MAREAKPLSYTPSPTPQPSYEQPVTYQPERSVSASTPGKELTLQDVIQFLQTMNGRGHQESLLKQENEALRLENGELKKSRQRVRATAW
ncbi:MAG: hypothetical protein LRY73_03415 [Bacillus sp. (in: Bacteria)]|nr:hypothetical protein [Bacillus sp. (in: firmicutes)]